MMKNAIFLLLLTSFTLDTNARSCGSYVKNGKKHLIPCSLGSVLPSSSPNSVQSCRAQITVGGRTINLQNRCIVRPAGKTGATTITKPEGARLERMLDLNATINRLADKYGVERALAHAVITVESAYRANVVSSKGAIGLMQLMPATAGSLGVEDPFNPEQNIDGGLRFLAELKREFQTDELALAAYNAGPNAVRRAGREIPAYTETQNYVQRVIAYRDKYREEWKEYLTKSPEDAAKKENAQTENSSKTADKAVEIRTNQAAVANNEVDKSLENKAEADKSDGKADTAKSEDETDTKQNSKLQTDRPSN